MTQAWNALSCILSKVKFVYVIGGDLDECKVGLMCPWKIKDSFWQKSDSLYLHALLGWFPTSALQFLIFCKVTDHLWSPISEVILCSPSTCFSKQPINTNTLMKSSIYFFLISSAISFIHHLILLSPQLHASTIKMSVSIWKLSACQSI